MLDMNSGYHGYSMSNRAYNSYLNNEKPFSKWLKSDIISLLKSESILAPEEIDKRINIVKSFNLKVVKDFFLSYSSYHHTSLYCNCTNFYNVNVDKFDDLSIKELENNLLIVKNNIENEEKRKAATPVNFQYVSFKYLEWFGTRKYPKATEKKAVGILINETIHYMDISTLKKKKITTKGVEILASKKDLRGSTFDPYSKKELKEIKKKLKL